MFIIVSLWRMIGGIFCYCKIFLNKKSREDVLSVVLTLHRLSSDAELRFEFFQLVPAVNDEVLGHHVDSHGCQNPVVSEGGVETTLLVKLLEDFCCSDQREGNFFLLTTSRVGGNELSLTVFTVNFQRQHCAARACVGPDNEIFCHNYNLII